MPTDYYLTLMRFSAIFSNNTVQNNNHHHHHYHHHNNNVKSHPIRILNSHYSTDMSLWLSRLSSAPSGGENWRALRLGGTCAGTYFRNKGDEGK